MRTWLGHRIPVRTLPPSLVLVKRLFLSDKSISGNVFVFINNCTIVINNNLLFVLIVTTSFRGLGSGVIVLMLRHLHAQDCPGLGLQKEQ